MSLTRTTGNIIPQELLDYIIDYLHNDKVTLRSCSVASKVLVDASFYHLFSSISLKVLSEAQQEGGRQWDDFVSFVMGSPNALRYIHQLCIDTPNPPSLFDYDADSYRTYPTLSLSNILHVLQRLPALEHLNLYHLRINTKIDDELTFSSEVQPLSLRSLSLCWCALDDRVFALPSIVQATKPSKLSLHHIRCLAPALLGRHALKPLPPLPNSDAPHHVQSVQIIGAFPVFGCCDDDDLFLAMPRFMPCIYSSLREFKLIGRGWEQKHLSQFMSSSYRSRTSLPNSFLVSSPGLFALQNAPMLQSVVIGISLIIALGAGNQWEAYIPLLASLPPSTESIRFDILIFRVLHDNLSVPLPDPAIFQRSLSRLPGLRSLTFQWGLKDEDRKHGMDKALFERVSQLVPEMWKSGVLRCEWSHFNKLYHSTGVPTDMGLLFPL